MAFIVRILGVLLWFGACTPSQAVVQAEVRLSELSFTLIDLDPADGVMPAFTIGAPGIRGDVHVGSEPLRGEQVVSGFDAQLDLSVASGAASAAARASAGELHLTGALTDGAEGNFWSHLLLASLTPLAPPGCFFLQCPPSTWVYDVFLSPQTAVRVAGKLHLSAQVNPGSDRREEAVAYFVSGLGNWHSPSPGWQRLAARAATFASESELWGEGLPRNTDLLDISFEYEARNDTDRIWSGEFYVHLYAYGGSFDYPPPPPIPEPGSGTLLLLGLAGLLAAGRRRAVSLQPRRTAHDPRPARALRAGPPPHHAASSLRVTSDDHRPPP